MRRIILTTCFLILLVLPVSLEAQKAFKKLVSSKDMKAEKLAGGFSFTEGPASDKEGNVYFTDQPNNKILLWDINDKLSVFMEPAGRSNGMFFGNDGYLYSCADEKTEIWKISRDGQKNTLVSSFNGKSLNGPNDLWVAPGGGIYFTDPFYKRPWWDYSQQPQDIQAVYFLAPGSAVASRYADGFSRPNGIVGTPDGRKLYVADIGAGKTWVFTIGNDGRLENRKLFCEMGSDGMTMDSKGNIYITGDGVTVFDSDGRKLFNIPVPEKWTANVCFGGKDHKSLFITASTGLYRVRMRVRGAY